MRGESHRRHGNANSMLVLSNNKMSSQNRYLHTIHFTSNSECIALEIINWKCYISHLQTYSYIKLLTWKIVYFLMYITLHILLIKAYTLLY
jgi:cellobiose phosphorylase